MPEFHGKKATNSKLMESLAISKWKSLTLNGTLIDDDGIACLAGVANKLTQIHLISDFVTDRSMPVLCGLPGLRSLLLNLSKVTDEGIRHVAKATELRELYLDNTQLTDDGIESFLGLKHIWSLKLDGTHVTDDGIHKLERVMHIQGVH